MNSINEDIETVLEAIRDSLGVNRKECIKELKEMRKRVSGGECPADILFNELGLEPEYIFVLI